MRIAADAVILIFISIGSWQQGCAGSESNRDCPVSSHLGHLKTVPICPISPINHFIFFNDFKAFDDGVFFQFDDEA